MKLLPQLNPTPPASHIAAAHVGSWLQSWDSISLPPFSCLSSCPSWSSSVTLVQPSHIRSCRATWGICNNNNNDLYAESGQTLQGSFSAVSKPHFASKYSLESSRRDLHNALLCTVLVGSVWVKKYTKINIEKMKSGKSWNAAAMHMTHEKWTRAWYRQSYLPSSAM